MSTERTLGEHSAKLEALGEDVSEIKRDIKTLLAEKNEAAGSKKTIITVASVIGTIGGALASTAVAKLFK